MANVTPNTYRELVAYLSPADRFAGEASVDRMILATLRTQVAPWNRQRLLCCAGAILLALGLCGLILRFPAFSVLLALPAFSLIAPFTVLVPLIAIGVAMIVFGLKLPDEQDRARFSPKVESWLSQHGMSESGLAHWDELAWPLAKRFANRTMILGFELWRRSPAPSSKVERIERQLARAFAARSEG